MMNRYKFTAKLLGALLMTSVTFGVNAQELKPEIGAGGLVQLKAKLDEPRGICFDIAGFRASIDYHIPVQAHTCKPDADNREDGLFIYDHPRQGNIYNAEYDLCLDAVSIVERGNVFMRPCSENASQVFNYQNQELQLTDKSQQVLCLAVSPSPSHPSVLNGTAPNPGVTFVARTMSLANCNQIDDAFKQWLLPESD